jgi:hypothetical protein
MTDDASTDRDEERQKVADALRARQSLESDAHGDEDVSAQGFTSGERFLGSDDPESGNEVALDDDDVEQAGGGEEGVAGPA